MNLQYLFVHMLVYNKQLLFNMHSVNIKLKKISLSLLVERLRQVYWQLWPVSHDLPKLCTSTYVKCSIPVIDSPVPAKPTLLSAWSQPSSEERLDNLYCMSNGVDVIEAIHHHTSCHAGIFRVGQKISVRSLHFM